MKLLRRARLPERESNDSDAGTSLIEIIVSIAILGTVGTAIVGGLFTAIVGSRIERDHARAHEWLQSATEVLVNDIAWKDCTTDTASGLATFYEDELQKYPGIVPPDWGQFDILVPVPVQYPDPSGAYGAPCDPDENRQKVVIQVRDPRNEIIESVEVVKVP